MCRDQIQNIINKIFVIQIEYYIINDYNTVSKTLPCLLYT